jgi:hypothetical protein
MAFYDLCDKVCNHEVTVEDALHRYCPQRRRKP